MIEHKSPTTATVKRLFAVSGNQCAFEKCEVTLVDKKSGKVTGRICHINARREGGPRFDPLQSEDNNRGFDNLILMCPYHHDVIDADIISYTKDRLISLKVTHSAKFEETVDAINDEQARKFIQNINIENIKIGSYFSISNVNHGQIANQIVNNGGDTAKLFVLERQISSLRQLQSIYDYLLPDKLYPEMDWDDVLNNIALRFDSIKSRMQQFKLDFLGYFDADIENKIDECCRICTEGYFGVDFHALDISSEAYNYAIELYEKFSGLLTQHKEAIRAKITEVVK